MWKVLFIIISTILLYYAYGVASHGGPWAFFAGIAIGTIVTYLFTRYKQEAQANTNTNTQSVNVNLNQQKLHIGDMSQRELLDLLNSAMDEKLLLLQQQQLSNSISAQRNGGVIERPLTRSELIAQSLRQLGRGNGNPNA